MRRGDLLVHDDTDRIVQQAFTKDDVVELWVDLVLVEDSEDRDRIRRGKGGPEYEAFDKRKL